MEIWSKYFPEAKRLIGCDINPICAELTYDDPRITVTVGDANSDSTESAISSVSLSFDIILDDGSHRSGDIIKSFLRYFPKVKQGGIYVAEDLHCSYWQSFEGGLYHPYSSIAFFKVLADIINHEHWGVASRRASQLIPIFRQYGISADDACLSTIHSIEFINSMCVIRKQSADFNGLGHRVVAGLVAQTEKCLLPLNGTGPVVYDQQDNLWAHESNTPDAQLIRLGAAHAALAHELELARAGISELTQLLAVRDGTLAMQYRELDEAKAGIERLMQTLAMRDNSIASQYRELDEAKAGIKQLTQTLAMSENLIATQTLQAQSLSAEISRLRKLLYGSSPDRHLYRAWRSLLNDPHYRQSDS